MFILGSAAIAASNCRLASSYQNECKASSPRVKCPRASGVPCETSKVSAPSESGVNQSSAGIGLAGEADPAWGDGVGCGRLSGLFDEHAIRNNPIDSQRDAT